MHLKNSFSWWCLPQFPSNQLLSIDQNSCDCKRLGFLGSPPSPLLSPLSLPPPEGLGVIYVTAELQVK